MTPAALRRVQRASALVFSIFVAVHLAAVAASLLGAAAFDRALALSRYVYGWLPVEGVLAAALLAHAGASLVLWWRRPPDLPRPLTAQLQTYAGFALLAFIGGHVAFMRIAPALEGFKADALYLQTGFEIWPTLFVPYYLALAAAGAFHLAYGVRFYFGRGPERTPQRTIYLALTVFCLVVAWRLPKMQPAATLDDARLRRYLAPFATLTPWLIDMGDEHPLVRRYQGRPPHGDGAPQP